MYSTAKLLVLLGAVLSLAAADQLSESRGGKRRRALAPLLMGVVLKVSSLIPMSLMLLALVVISALFAAKLALLISAAVGIHSSMTKPHAAVTEINELAARIPEALHQRRRRIRI